MIHQVRCLVGQLGSHVPLLPGAVSTPLTAHFRNAFGAAGAQFGGMGRFPGGYVRRAIVPVSGCAGEQCAEAAAGAFGGLAR